MQQRDIVLHPYSEKQNHILVIFMFLSYFSYKIIWPDLHISSIVYFLTLWNMWHFPNHITEMHWRYICKDLIYNKSTFDHVMAWFLVAPSHIPIQCWHRYKIQYYMTRPQLVYSFPPGQDGCHFTDVFKCIFLNENFVCWFEFQWSLFLRVLMIISRQHVFR